MDKKKIDNTALNFHFIGIGGISMSGLAKHLLYNNNNVTGSDRVKSYMTEELENMGAKINYTHNKSNIEKDSVVIYSSAIDENNEELKFAKEQNNKIYKRSEFLGEIIKNYKNSVLISGSHGKTTTTSMISHILMESKLNPTVFSGGEDLDFGNYKKGNTDYVVAEACEYKNNFKDLDGKIKVVLNIDNDHLDSFGNMENLISSFRNFVGDSICVKNNDDKNSESIENETTVTFGINKASAIMAKKIRNNKGYYSFSVYESNINLGRINLKIAGYHNIYNCLSSIAVARILKIPFIYIKRGVEKFKGVKRRNEFIGEKNGVRYYADYAHHPKEIESILTTYNNIYDKYLIIFQPHLYSRTKLLMEDFVKVFTKNKNDLIIYKTYPAREKEIKEGNGERLAREIENKGKKNIKYTEEETALKKYLISEKNDNKTVLVLGAGDIYNIVKEIIK